MLLLMYCAIQELLAEEAANRKDIEDVIEEERAKVDAKTQITQGVFLQWRQKNKDDKIKQQEAVEADRKKKGIMTGREIFAQVQTLFCDGPDRGIILQPILLGHSYFVAAVCIICLHLDIANISAENTILRNYVSSPSYLSPGPFLLP